MIIKSPEEIAREVYGQEPGDGWAVGSSEVVTMIIAAIEVDRAQFFDTSGSASSQHFIDTGRYLLHEEVEEWRAREGGIRECQRCGAEVQCLNSSDECEACAALPECDECDTREGDPDQQGNPIELGRWPRLSPPVTLCPSCTHNAYRSGWEPGQ